MAVPAIPITGVNIRNIMSGMLIAGACAPAEAGMFLFMGCPLSATGEWANVLHPAPMAAFGPCATLGHRSPVPTEDINSPLITIDSEAPQPFEIRELWAFRDFLYFLVWRDIKVRYRQTLVGVGWAIVQPLLAMVILSAVFGRSARLPSEGVPYPLFAYAGLLAWTFFSNAVFSSSNSIVGNGPLITKIYFPRLLVPVGAVVARSLDFAIAFLLLLVLMAWYGTPFTSHLLILPLLAAMTMSLALACGLWLSALNVKYRDVNVALPHVLQFLMFATPVFYSSTMLPGRLQWLARLNPLAVLIDGYRSAFFGRSFNWPALTVCAVIGLVLLFISVVSFRHMEQQFADVV